MAFVEGVGAPPTPKFEEVKVPSSLYQIRTPAVIELADNGIELSLTQYSTGNTPDPLKVGVWALFNTVTVMVILVLSQF